MIKIFIYTEKQRIKDWSDKFLRDLTFEQAVKKNISVKVGLEEQIITTQIFNVHITSSSSIETRGRSADVIVIDREISETKEQDFNIMLAAGKKLKKTENYKRI